MKQISDGLGASLSCMILSDREDKIVPTPNEVRWQLKLGFSVVKVISEISWLTYGKLEIESI